MTSFQAEPPTITLRGETVRLRPYGERGGQRIIAQLSNLKTPESLAAALLVAYAALYSLPPADALRIVENEEEFSRALGEADMELSSEDITAVDEYLAGIFKRKDEARVTVDESPGKPTTEEIRPATLHSKSTSSPANTAGV